jgi:hypothetical protein
LAIMHHLSERQACNTFAPDFRHRQSRTIPCQYSLAYKKLQVRGTGGYMLKLRRAYMKSMTWQMDSGSAYHPASPFDIVP